MKALLTFVSGAVFWAGFACLAEAVTVPQTELAYDSSTTTYTLSWYGTASHTYFIQHSPDLFTWNTMPVIESGTNAALAWSIQINADKTFFRLLVSDLPTGGNPETADFDGDGIDNITEVNLGSNPISVDSDRDGMSDAWEHLHGFSLTVPDATGDADGDGLSNLAEFLAGTNPTTAASAVSAVTFALVVGSP